MKAIFMGTPIFAVPSLETLCESDFEVALVITQPDRRKDRGKKFQPPPVKIAAEERNLEVYQPEKVNTVEAVEKIRSVMPDLIVVTAYGQILPKEILDLPKLGCINVHASLLPKYRGAAPIHYALICGEEKSGITTMYMAEGLDTGDMILQDEISIETDWNSERLHDELAELSRKTLRETLIQLLAGKALRIPQRSEEASYAGKIDRHLGEIDWRCPAKEIHNLVRGTCPWPGAYTYYKDQVMKVIGTQETEEAAQKNCGVIQKITKDGFIVAAKDYGIKITEIQMPGKKKMPVSEYLKGHLVQLGEQLGQKR